jgi:hypothetical protein
VTQPRARTLPTAYVVRSVAIKWSCALWTSLARLKLRQEIQRLVGDQWNERARSFRSAVKPPPLPFHTIGRDRRLSARRVLYGQVMRHNPAVAVRWPGHVVKTGRTIPTTDRWLGPDPVSRAATRSSVHPSGSNASGKSLYKCRRGGQILCPFRQENAASDRRRRRKQGDRTVPRVDYLEAVLSNHY